MNIEILANSDDNFKIQVKKFGEQFVATDGERVSIAVTEELAIEGVQEMQQGINPSDPVPVVENPRAAPLENSRRGHPFDFFGGTSWEGKKQDVN